MKEIWKPAVGFSKYEVSNLGRVRHKGNDQAVRKPYPYPDGYLVISSLYTDDGGRRTIPVHRLVALAFLGPRPTGYHTDHIDGDRSNNRADNLRYITPKENARNCLRFGSKPLPGRPGRVKVTPEEAKQIKCLTQLQKQDMLGGSYADIARLFGVRKSLVEDIGKGKSWTDV